jgi:hypothetical protein
VVLALNFVYLPISSIEVYVSGKIASSEQLAALLTSLSGEAPQPGNAYTAYQEPQRLAS